MRVVPKPRLIDSIRTEIDKAQRDFRTIECIELTKDELRQVKCELGWHTFRDEEEFRTIYGQQLRVIP